MKINENLTKKTKKRIEVKEAEIKSLQKTVKRIRNEHDDVKDKLKKNEAIHDAAVRNLQAELEKLEKRNLLANLSRRKSLIFSQNSTKKRSS